MNELTGWFKRNNDDFKKGKTWTTDAPYRETKKKLEYFLNLGADVVEMEASAMFNVARFRQVAVANVFVVGDSISGGRFNPDFRSKDNKKKFLLAAKKIVRFLSDNPS
jgi:purine-nucleoside phosphorylase